MPAKVPQFEAIATKFISCIDCVILNAFFLHAFDKHLKYRYKTNAREFKPASFCTNVLSPEPPTLFWSQDNFLKCHSEEWEGGVTSFPVGVPWAEASVGVTHTLLHRNTVPVELMSAWCNTFHREDVGSFPPARETALYPLGVHERSWAGSSINCLSPW